MRENLFRAQTRRYGEKVRMGDGQKLPSRWVYGGVLQGVGVHSIIYGGEKENDPSVGLDKHVVYTDTLGQFTGMTDIGGKRIFEGDIMKTAVTGLTPHIGVVEFAEGAFGLRCTDGAAFFLCYVAGSCTIIGNIHDNPELLESGHV